MGNCLETLGGAHPLPGNRIPGWKLSAGVLLALWGTAALLACGTVEPVTATRFHRLWDASIEAAGEAGFRIVQKDRRAGMIVGRRDADGEDSAVLRISVRPSVEGYRVYPVIRSEPARAHALSPSRTRAASAAAASRRYTRQDRAAPSRHFDEEARLLDAIRVRAAVPRKRRK